MSEHTSTPWHIEIDKENKDRNWKMISSETGWQNVVEPDIYWVGRINGQSYPVYGVRIKDEDAEFIIRACNLFEDLLNELKEILSWAVTENAPLREQEIESIRAAIAKASRPEPAPPSTSS